MIWLNITITAIKNEIFKQRFFIKYIDMIYKYKLKALDIYYVILYFLFILNRIYTSILRNLFEPKKEYLK